MKPVLLHSCITLLLFLFSCAPEDDIIDNAINVYPDVNIKYYNHNDSTSAEVVFHSINAFGQPLRLIDDQKIWYNDSIMDFDLSTGKYLRAEYGREDFHSIKWIHDEDSVEVFLNMNSFHPSLSSDSLSKFRQDSVLWDDLVLQEDEYISIYMGDSSHVVQYLFHNTIGTKHMLLDSSQVNKFNISDSIYLAPNRTKQFGFDLSGYRGSQGATIIYADTIFTSIK